jgi:phytoene dehydrogenase-like protein
MTLPDCPSLGPAGGKPGRDLAAAITWEASKQTYYTVRFLVDRDRARGEVFRRLATLGITGLESHLKFEVTFTPLSRRKRYNLTKGATYGLCHNLAQLGYLRPHNRHSTYDNLYFVGASTHPGTGVPTALVSARLAAERVADDLGLSQG